MKTDNNLIDQEIKDWIASAYKIDIEACSDIAEKFSIDIANQLVLSVVKKVGAIEGINKANDILKELNIDTEIESSALAKEINNLNELELKLIALRTCNLSRETKQKLIDRYISETNLSEKKSPSVTELLKEEINKVYRNLGELPSSNINEVRLVKNQKKSVAIRPFGRKKSK